MFVYIALDKDFDFLERSPHARDQEVQVRMDW